MADYSKWKVTELKAELKTRGVPQTGLRLKQDFVDKLIALDSDSAEQPAAEDAISKTSNAEEEKVEGNERDQKIDERPASQQSATESLPTEGAPSPQKQISQPDAALPHSPQLAAVEPEDAKQETTQAGIDQQSSIDHPPSQTEEPAQPVAAAENHEIQARDIDMSELGDEPSIQTEATPVQAPSQIDEAEPLPPAPENIDDLRKRKRRSQSPPPSKDVVKKSKIDNENPRVILKEDVAPENGNKQEAVPEAAALGESHQPPPLPAGDDQPSSFTGRQDPRFKDLLLPAKQTEPVQSSEQNLQDDDREVEPALHPATSAIYVRNLMRPLQPLSLKKHLQLLATPAGKEPGEDSLVDFFLDSIKTHCFALFDSVSMASRVRSKLHGAIWPNERDRKPLWVDFIPENKMSDWIRTEQDSTSVGRGGQRWEVSYEETPHGIEAILQEPRGGGGGGGGGTGRPLNAPTAPARRQSQNLEQRRESQPSGPSRQKGSSEGFKALDDRFQSTKTKPKLYYLPVARATADKRLAQFGTLIRKDSRNHGQGGDDMRRISFEDVDMFVDGGPEYRGPRNRGGGRGFGRGSGRGAWRGRRH